MYYDISLSEFLRFDRLISVKIEIQNCTEETFFSSLTNIFMDLLICVCPWIFFSRFPVTKSYCFSKKIIEAF